MTTGQKHFPTGSTAKRERAKHVLVTCQAAARGDSHGHLSAGSDPHCSRAAHFPHGLTWGAAQASGHQERCPAGAQHRGMEGPHALMAGNEVFVSQGAGLNTAASSRFVEAWKGVILLGLGTCPWLIRAGPKGQGAACPWGHVPWMDKRGRAREMGHARKLRWTQEGRDAKLPTL